MTKVTLLSQEAFDRLTAELHELETEGRLNVQRRIQTAREQGDLRENAEYHQAKEDQAFLEGRIAELRSLLETAQVGHATGGGEVVEQGVRVTLKDEDGDEETYVFTSTHNESELPVISPESPLGLAIQGHAVGDVIVYEAPAGKLTVEITSIDV
ncbi:MAG: transcription elongation factor GreA [Actinobacteria bacterium ATB1]|nr:transcription elongation factor GreA [Actinobacteria bacterium ATB1]